MLFPVSPVVLEADPSLFGPVNDHILEFKFFSKFSGGKEKVNKSKIFFLFRFLGFSGQCWTL